MKKKINVEQVRLGMHIHELCGPWMSHPFWRTKFILRDPEDIRRLKESAIKEVWIDSAKGFDVEESESEEEVAAKVEKVLKQASIREEQPKRVTVTEELQQAAKTCAKATDAVRSMFAELRMGKALSTGAVDGLVEEISSSLDRNPGALLSLARLKTADDYTYMHSVAVSALMVSLARQMRFNDADVHEAGRAGLLHDVGKANIPMKVLNKPGKLTDEEFYIVKGHPEEGHRILLAAKSTGEVPLDVVLHHHEKIDGSGYPHRLMDGEINHFAKMGAVCDVYDAITSNRPYKQGWDPTESIQKMTEWSGSHFDPEIFQAFVKCIGIYPTGSLVCLTSGRIGVVLDQSPKSLLTPQVKVFFSTRTKTYMVKPEVVDLSRHGCLEKIVGIEDAARWGIKNVSKYWAAPD
ncbi:MAG: HD-GYP domain-containing protein [Sterolibacterium sp.]|nr:HD-GYP domain-containing protein [Sterolibacterium sp.]